MLIFSGTSNKPLAEKVAHLLNIPLSTLEAHTFPDGERRIKVPPSVVGEDAVIIQSTNPPVDQNYMELFFIIDALKRTGAKSITAVVPYMGYQRQDHVFREGEARSLEVVINILEALCINRFVSFEFHSVKIPEIFTVDVDHLSALPMFAKVIQENNWVDSDTVLVTPDMGGIRRIKIISEMLKVPYATIKKDRDLESGSIEVSTLEGEVKKRAIIVDDMISSGGTIVKASELLAKHGAEEIFVFATHAVFSDHASKHLEASLARRVFVTDTIEIPNEKKFPKLEILSISQIIAKELK